METRVSPRRGDRQPPRSLRTPPPGQDRPGALPLTPPEAAAGLSPHTHTHTHTHTHPPVTMKTSRKKEPMAEEMVSVLHTEAMAWNRLVALRRGAGSRGQGEGGADQWCLVPGAG